MSSSSQNSSNANPDYIHNSKEINDEIQEQSNDTLQTLSLGGLVNAITLSMLNNTANQYSSQTLANSAMVQTCNKILGA
ncbi:hypothetical protein [Idiomarina xiamenensis]|uniref:Uncharacterized protein n=1 Tax=Idiomarina xiamenensis 10-D-4 TaxID=740709 RepID=K2KPM8_9GAMM|nr:hypothetical protein [Idiomarina xiamenensis]EKE84409.1 hypothetical protein A10D4_05057 [Idiomarina xiamenensis 10-D-4]